MSTYYAAQLGIALSVVDSKATYIQEEETRIKQLEAAGSIPPPRGGSIGAQQLRRRGVAKT